jgi:hypothetical protein
MNKKLIIILGVLFLLLIIFTGVITHYKWKEAQTQLSFDKGENSVLDYSFNSPSNFKELSGFIKILKNAVFLDEKRLESAKEIRTVGLYMPEKSFLSNFDIIKNYLNEKHISFPSLDSIPALKAGQYFGISLNTQDIIQINSNSFLSEENILHFCAISEPALEDPLFEEIESDNDFWFSQGSISCMEVKPNEDHAIIFVGFVPQAELISIKLYLVDDFTINNIRNAQSFLEMKEVLNDYNILWQMEKPINL